MANGEDAVESVLQQLLANDNADVAAAWIDAAVETLGDTPRIVARLCEASIRLGDRERADGFLRRLKARLPPNPTLALLEAHFETYFGDAASAIALLQGMPTDRQGRLTDFLLSLAHFRIGDFANGARLYENRLHVSPPPYAKMAEVQRKLWVGDAPAAARLCVLREQGLGDELLFLRCVDQLTALGFAFDIVTSPCMRAFLGARHPQANVMSIDDPGLKDVVAAAEQIVYAGSLPHLVQSVTGAPADAYVGDPDALPPAGDLRRIGIAWRTSSRIGDARRSMPLAEFLAPLRDRTGADIVAIQPDVTPEEDALLRAAFGVRYLGRVEAAGKGEPKDVLAGELLKCDAVVSVSTTACYLAAVLDVPTALLLTSGSDPRWRYAGDVGFLAGMFRIVETEDDADRTALVDRLAAAL